MKTGYLYAISFGTMLVCASGSANAAPLVFNFSGPSGTAVFELDSNPTPDFESTILPGSDQFGFNNVTGTYEGTPGFASTISFGEGIIASLNIVAPGLGFTQFGGPALFTGSASAPVFTPGTYTLANPFFGNGTLTISSVAGVPEPATWAMMIIGLGLSGAAMRYHQRSTTGVLA